MNGASVALAHRMRWGKDKTMIGASVALTHRMRVAADQLQRAALVFEKLLEMAAWNCFGCSQAVAARAVDACCDGM